MINFLRFKFLIIAFSLLFLSACGYRFSGEGKGPCPEFNKIAIPMFENSTAEPRLEVVFTSALRREFNIRGGFKLVPSDQAQMIFHGRVKRLTTTDIAHREAKDTIETRITVTLAIQCRDAENNTVIWEDPNMTYYEEYFRTGNPITDFENRRHALEKIAREMAIRIHDRFSSGF